MKTPVRFASILWLASLTVVPGQLWSQTPPQKTLHVFDWKDGLVPPGGQVFSTNGVSVLKVENTNNAPLEMLLLTLTNPSLIAKADFISGDMKYQDVGLVLATAPRFPMAHVQVNANLTLLQYFQPDAAGGDETTNADGYGLKGTSNWKPYYFSTGKNLGRNPPIKLELKLSLPTNGTVFLRPIKLTRLESGSSGWWAPQQSGLLGGIGGSLIGCLGGLIGWLVSKGRARRFVLVAVKCCIALGILMTVAGLAAAVFDQPYHVWYALLLPGAILVLVFSLNLHSIKRRYDELEIRRMTSIDAAGT